MFCSDHNWQVLFAVVFNLLQFTLSNHWPTSFPVHSFLPRMGTLCSCSAVQLQTRIIIAFSAAQFNRVHTLALLRSHTQTNASFPSKVLRLCPNLFLDFLLRTASRVRRVWLFQLPLTSLPSSFNRSTRRIHSWPTFFRLCVRAWEIKSGQRPCCNLLNCAESIFALV